MLTAGMNALLQYAPRVPGGSTSPGGSQFGGEAPYIIVALVVIAGIVLITFRIEREARSRRDESRSDDARIAYADLSPRLLKSMEWATSCVNESVPVSELGPSLEGLQNSLLALRSSALIQRPRLHPLCRATLKDILKTALAVHRATSDARMRNKPPEEAIRIHKHLVNLERALSAQFTAQFDGESPQPHGLGPPRLSSSQRRGRG